MNCIICGKELLTGDIHWQQCLCNKCYEDLNNGFQDSPLTNPKCHIIKTTSHLLFVEDGSVDTDKLIQELEPLGIKIIIYRQGAQKPELIKLEEKKNENNKTALRNKG